MIEKYKHEGEGYNPFLIADKWQVAQLNYAEGLGVHDLKRIDIHFLTDEAFILLNGTSILIAIEKNGDKLTFEAIKMKERVTYNIPKNMWHNIALESDAQVLIIEDANTHLGDYEFYYLNESQKQNMDACIQNALHP